MSERVCPRCGEELPSRPDDLDPEELWLPDPLPVGTVDGEVHRDCATLAEQRYADSRCQRCGTQFHDDGRDSDAGWITDVDSHRLLCPDCITPAEDRAYTQQFLDTITRGQLYSELEHRDYPSDLAALAAIEAERLRRASDDPRGP